MDRTRTLGTMSLEEYLSFEERSSSRHEYVAGEVYAMTGASTRHNTITLNIVRHLHGPARGCGCRVFATDVKVRSAEDRIYYPDVMVACGEATHVEMIVEAPSPCPPAVDPPRSGVRAPLTGARSRAPLLALHPGGVADVVLLEVSRRYQRGVECQNGVHNSATRSRPRRALVRRQAIPQVHSADAHLTPCH